MTDFARPEDGPDAAGARIAIIPARGGSKRIPRKNIRPFAGRPMIHWAIEAARDSGLFAAVCVSTDDEEIAAIAKEAGAQVPGLRDASLSDDHTPLRPVIRDGVRRCRDALGISPALVCAILPTAVLLDPADLRRGAQAVASPEVAFAFAAGRFPAPVQRALRADSDGGVAMLYPEPRLTRTQDLEETFYDAGQFYWGREAAFETDETMFGARSRAILIDPDRAVDIDDLDDWHRAELMHGLIEARRKGGPASARC